MGGIFFGMGRGGNRALKIRRAGDESSSSSSSSSSSPSDGPARKLAKNSIPGMKFIIGCGALVGALLLFFYYHNYTNAAYYAFYKKLALKHLMNPGDESEKRFNEMAESACKFEYVVNQGQQGVVGGGLNMLMGGGMVANAATGLIMNKVTGMMTAAPISHKNHFSKVDKALYNGVAFLALIEMPETPKDTHKAVVDQYKKGQKDHENLKNWLVERLMSSMDKSSDVKKEQVEKYLDAWINSLKPRDIDPITNLLNVTGVPTDGLGGLIFKGGLTAAGFGPAMGAWNAAQMIYNMDPNAKAALQNAGTTVASMVMTKV